MRVEKRGHHAFQVNNRADPGSQSAVQHGIDDLKIATTIGFCANAVALGEIER